MCDSGMLHAGYACLVDHGYVDANRDGMNDRYQDADGDGICDVTGMPYGHPFGRSDQDGDGVNDRFVDADGDGTNDLTGHSYVQGYRHAPGTTHRHGPLSWPFEPPEDDGGGMTGGPMGGR